VLDAIETGKRDGARLVAGGGRPTGEAFDHGFFTEPTIFADAHMGMQLAQEEVFGPVLAIIPVDGFDQAIEAANAVRYGLSASVYTRDLVLAQRFVDAIDVGIVHVNNPTVGGEAQLPFGGMKETGVGERLVNNGVDGGEVMTRGDLGHHAAVHRVQIRLRRHHVAEDATAIDHRGGGLVTRRLDCQHRVAHAAPSEGSRHMMSASS
jgi:hypothetical protein